MPFECAWRVIPDNGMVQPNHTVDFGRLDMGTTSIILIPSTPVFYSHFTFVVTWFCHVVVS